MPELIDLIALSLLPLSWRRDLGEQLRAGCPPAAVLNRVVARNSRDPHYTLTGVASRATAILDRAVASATDLVPWTDARYPPILAAIDDPPPVLWARGLVSRLDRPTVAIVGSRVGSPYAISVAERLSGDLAARGVVIVSGLARGVDSAAHRGALAAAGATAAVLGSGIDVTYPREHESLARDVAGSGVVLSELPPGTPPLPEFFPARNRIISGLSRGVVIVEAGLKSGSLITARCALDQGRDVFAVPGNVLSGLNRGGHALLKDGARVVETADDVLEELGLGPGAAGSRVTTEEAVADEGGTDPVLAVLPPGEPCDLDSIARQSGVPVPQLLARLSELEARGLVVRGADGRFVRFDRTC